MDKTLTQNTNNNQNVLKRALYYESQYRNAILSNAISFYDANLSKDIIESDIFYKTPDGSLKSSLDRIGMTFPCKFSDFINNWISDMVSSENKSKIPSLKDVRQTLLDYYNEGKREYVVNYWADVGNGRRLYLNQSFLLTKDENGDIWGLSIVKDHTSIQINEEENRRKELEQYAFYDPITKGHNYIKFKANLKSRHIPGSIISIDIHSFKIINSVCGIIKGDQVIEAIWNAISNALDFKGGDLAGHINADHFIMFVPTDDEEAIIRKLKNITLALNFISGELEVPQLLPYYGVSKWNPEKRIELSYSESVVAKHNAKKLQKTNYAFFDETDTERLIKEKAIVEGFEPALLKKEFKIWYQPKYNPADGELVGAEALVRWQKEDGTFVSPGDFIPIFEKNGMIRTFDEYIFTNVCRQQKKWKDQNKILVPVSINLSRISLYYKKIVAEYKKISEEIGIEKELLPIEITESAAVTNNEIKEIADAFYEAGFRLHMDDFGSGYSSLATLNIMHFDTLKLDKSLIDYIGNYGGDRLLEHTILLAKDLGMHVTAEGVEDSNQVSFLKELGCDSIQGYFYSKPLPLEKFELLLEDKK